MSPGLGARRWYERSRARLSWLCDRGVETADALTLRARALPEPAWPWVMSSVHRLGTLVALAGSAPRCDMWCVSCGGTEVVIIGSQSDALGVTRMLEGDIERLQVVGRIAQWRLRSGVSALLQDVDLVVCGLPAAGPARLQLPRATLRFSSEPMVGQRLTLDRPAAELLRGPERSEVRRKLARLEQASVAVKVTQDRDAFAAFHRDMYLPHVERRHGRSAIITPADRQWRDTMAAGGVLLLLVRDDRPLAGVLLRQIGPVAFLGEEGLSSQALDDPQLGSSLQAGLRWEGIRWALAHGARHAALGLSPGWAASGVFRAKRLWRAQVEPPWRAGQHHWHFLLSDRTTSMRARLDTRRLITFRGRRPLLVRLPEEHESFDLDGALHEAHTTGTAGIVVITAAGSSVHVTDARGS
jgi:hypothetical protein